MANKNPKWIKVGAMQPQWRCDPMDGHFSEVRPYIARQENFCIVSAPGTITRTIPPQGRTVLMKFMLCTTQRSQVGKSNESSW